MHAFVIVFFSALSIVLTELYLQAIIRAKCIEGANKRDFAIIIIYITFILVILSMSVSPDYIAYDDTQFPNGTGIMSFIPFFNMGIYGLVNIKRVIAILGTKTNHKD